jgi:hypothetical protein
VERESLRLLLSLNPFDLLPNVAERVGWSSFRMAGVGRHWLEFLQPVPSPRANLVSDFEDVERRIPCIQSGTAGYMKCAQQSQAD